MTAVLDTRSVPAADRREYWSAGIAERFFPMRVEEFVSPSFEARLASGQLGSVAVQSIQGLAHRVARTQQMIAAADPESILLYLLTKGEILIGQDERQCLLRPGDLACQDTSTPSIFESRGGFEVLVFSVPKWFIGTRAETIVGQTAIRVGGGSRGGLTTLTAPFLANLARTALGGNLDERDGPDAAQMLLPMLSSMFERENPSALTTRPQTLLAQMQRFALDQLHDPQLGPELIAQAHYVSTRYVHKLFAQTGLGVSAWIRERRLEGAAGELRRFPERSVASIAAKWGYLHPASFSRAFREVHGYSPRDARLAA